MKEFDEMTEEIRALWMKRTFSGPSEKYDHEEKFDRWLSVQRNYTNLSRELAWPK